MGALVLVGSPGIGERCGPPGSFRPRTSHALHYDSELSADTEFVDDGPVPSGILGLEIFQEPPALADQHQQAPTRVMILRVGLEMLGQSVDPLGQERDLDLGRPGVALVGLELLDQALLAVDSQRHRGPPIASSQRSLPRSGSKKPLYLQQIADTLPRGTAEVKESGQRRRRAVSTSSAIWARSASTFGKRRSSLTRETKTRRRV